MISFLDVPDKALWKKIPPVVAPKPGKRTPSLFSQSPDNAPDLPNTPVPVSIPIAVPVNTHMPDYGPVLPNAPVPVPGMVTWKDNYSEPFAPANIFTLTKKIDFSV